MCQPVRRIHNSQTPVGGVAARLLLHGDRLATVSEAASFRRCSIWTIFAKIREGDLVALKDGRVTKITVASLVKDRDRALATTRRPSRTAHRPLDATQPVAETKRKVGRPPLKPRAAEPQPASGRRVLEQASS